MEAESVDALVEVPYFPAASMSIQDSGARGQGSEDACLCTVADGHSEGDIKTNVMGLPVYLPKFFH